MPPDRLMFRKWPYNAWTVRYKPRYCSTAKEDISVKGAREEIGGKTPISETQFIDP